MKNLFNDISQDERNRILEMHKSATRKNYLSEQTPAPAPTTVPTGPTVTRRPAVVPGGDNPQGSPPLYRQVDVETFNPKFQLCWNEKTNAGINYSKQQLKAIEGGDETLKLQMINSKAIRMAMFKTINQFYLNSLTNPMSSGELERLWNTNIKNLPVTHDFTDPNKPQKIVTQISSTVGKLIPSVYTDEKQMKVDYINTFRCALQATQGT